MSVNVDINTRVIHNMLKNDITTFYRIWGETCAIEARDRITLFAQEEMNNYYGEYTPIIYDRTGQMFNDSYTPFAEKSKNYYTGGVTINFDNPTTDHKKWGDFSEEGIYELVWEKGLHPVGYSKYRGNIKYVGSGINHYKTVEKKAYAIKDEISEIGMKKAKSSKYSILSFNK